MALTRKFLSALGIEADKVDEIIEAHSESVNALKEQRDKAQEEATVFEEQKKELEKVTKERDKLQTKLDALADDDDKYKKLSEEFEAYKKQVAEKETKTKVEAAYRKLLKAENVADKYIDAVMRVTDLKGQELDDEGNLKNAKELAEAIKKDWAEFISTKGTEGADTPTPPKKDGGAGGSSGRAAELAAKYNEAHYGVATKQGD